jgi:hypothetical protein
MEQKYRIYLNDEYATQAQLDLVEEIAVIQEIDAQWQASITFATCLDERGYWSRELEQYETGFARARIELKVDDRSYEPLIDGPIIGHESQFSSEPGQSTVTLSVADDSVFLNREGEFDRHEERSPSDIAREIFRPHLPVLDIQEADPDQTDLDVRTVQNDAPIRFLRRLATLIGYRAYVLPGEEPGQSVGCFRELTTEPSDLPDLVVVGSDRNVRSFEVTRDNEAPSRVTASALSFSDKVVITRTSTFRNLEILGDEQAFEDEERETALRTLPPGRSHEDDPQRAVDAATAQTRYPFEATGSLIPGCYPAILQPYKLVNILVGGTPLSGLYLVKRVQHTINRSVYTQEFTVMRDAEASPIDEAGDILSGIF